MRPDLGPESPKRNQGSVAEWPPPKHNQATMAISNDRSKSSRGNTTPTPPPPPKDGDRFYVGLVKSKDWHPSDNCFYFTISNLKGVDFWQSLWYEEDDGCCYFTACTDGVDAGPVNQGWCEIGHIHGRLLNVEHTCLYL